MGSRRYVVLGLWVLTADVWFQGPLAGRWVGPLAAVPLAIALLALAGWEIARRPRPAQATTAEDRLFLWAIAVIVLLATLVRLPALAAPASLISSDSAVAGIIAQELAAGQRPAPIYAPGFPYEGTLKPHLTALFSWLLPAGIPTTYAWTSHLFHLMWSVAVMVLARQAAGLPAATAAGLFMAISPRFLVAFSLNNVGQYPEVSALGALALVAFSTRGAMLAAGFLLGLAVWQQLLAVYFVATVAVLVLATPALRRPRGIAEVMGGFLCGSYPLWVWNAANGWATFDLFRRGGKQPGDRIAGLPDRIERTLAVSFPKMFGLTDLGAGPDLALVLGAALPALVLVMAVASPRRHQAAPRARPRAGRPRPVCGGGRALRRLQVQPSRRAASAIPDAGVHVGRGRVSDGASRASGGGLASRPPPPRPPSWERTSWGWCPGCRAVARPKPATGRCWPSWIACTSGPDTLGSGSRRGPFWPRGGSSSPASWGRSCPGCTLGTRRGSGRQARTPISLALETLRRLSRRGSGNLRAPTSGRMSPAWRSSTTFAGESRWKRLLDMIFRPVHQSRRNPLTTIRRLFQIS